MVTMRRYEGNVNVDYSLQQDLPHVSDGDDAAIRG